MNRRKKGLFANLLEFLLEVLDIVLELFTD